MAKDIKETKDTKVKAADKVTPAAKATKTTKTAKAAKAAKSKKARTSRKDKKTILDQDKTITIQVDGEPMAINIDSILYVSMEDNYAYIHLSKEEIYKTRITMTRLAPQLGDDFVFIKQGCLVAVIAIFNITDKVNLMNGETLDYAKYNKSAIIHEYFEKKERIYRSLSKQQNSNNNINYLEYYKVFDDIPIAFADIEMVFDTENTAIDWVFRYGNEALAKLEKVDLEKLIGNTFGTIFPNMDAKWLRTYERVALFGETLNIVDYSREIDTKLNIICFPTFKGHCGCILIDIDKIKFFRMASESENAIATYMSKLLG